MRECFAEPSDLRMLHAEGDHAEVDDDAGDRPGRSRPVQVAFNRTEWLRVRDPVDNRTRREEVDHIDHIRGKHRQDL